MGEPGRSYQPKTDPGPVPPELVGTGEGGEREGEASAERRYAENGSTNFAPTPGPRGGDVLGRWPANLLLDEHAAALLDEQSGEQVSGTAVQRHGGGRAIFGGIGTGEGDGPAADVGYGDTGGASRFFYCAKASRAERNAGLEGFEEDRPDATPFNPTKPVCNICGCGTLVPGPGKRLACCHNDYRFEPSEGAKGGGQKVGVRNPHPLSTVKPIDLMRWLVRLVTPPGGTVLDPFTGSGDRQAQISARGYRFLSRAGARAIIFHRLLPVDAQRRTGSCKAAPAGYGAPVSDWEAAASMSVLDDAPLAAALERARRKDRKR